MEDPLLEPEQQKARQRSTKPSDGNVTRVQLELQAKAMDRLRKLKVETEATTYAEVIRNALRLYEFAIEKHEQGSEFMLKQKDGTIVPLSIF